MKRLVILGAGESGLGAAILGIKTGYEVFLSDSSQLTSEVKTTLGTYNLQWEEGQHTSSRILEADLVVKSPGIPNETEIVVAIQNQNIPIVSDIEFASWHTKGTLVAITGSNGKTTTSHLAYEVLKNAGYDVALVGNVGHSFCKQVALNDRAYYVIEVSSFQLEHIKKFKPKIAVLTNLVPDHLNRYGGSFESYVKAKMKLLSNQDETDHVIYNEDNKTIQDFFKTIDPFKPQKHPFSTNHKTENGSYYDKDSDQMITQLNQNPEPLCLNVSDLFVKGQHNLKNCMAASIVGHIFKIRNEKIREVLSLFKGVEHRMELVCKIKGVTYINDTKSTNVNSAYYALEAVKTPIVWIVGGQDKGNNYAELDDLVIQKVKAIVCLGVDNQKLLDHFSNKVQNIRSTQNIKDAVLAAHDFAESGDTVLLSPACASFDLFKNFEQRGKLFKEEVRQL